MYMNWMRTILDGFAMAVYFNLFAAAVALYKPRLMFPCYPPAIIKAAEEPPTKAALGSCCPSSFMVRSVLWRAGQQASGVWP